MLLASTSASLPGKDARLRLMASRSSTSSPVSLSTPIPEPPISCSRTSVSPTLARSSAVFVNVPSISVSAASTCESSGDSEGSGNFAIVAPACRILLSFDSSHRCQLWSLGRWALCFRTNLRPSSMVSSTAWFRGIPERTFCTRERNRSVLQRYSMFPVPTGIPRPPSVWRATPSQVFARSNTLWIPDFCPSSDADSCSPVDSGSTCWSESGFCPVSEADPRASACASE